jgi:Acetyl-coenzyme A synthetase N-terminus
VNEAPHQAIDALFLEERRYPAPPELAKEANAQPGIYDRDFAEFWASEARECVSWSTPFDQVCQWDPPYARWFLGGRLNASPSNVLWMGRRNSCAYQHRGHGDPGDDHSQVSS